MKNFVNEKKGKSRCSDGERTLKCDYFIAGNSNPAVVHLLLLYSIIKIEKGLTFEVSYWSSSTWHTRSSQVKPFLKSCLVFLGQPNHITLERNEEHDKSVRSQPSLRVVPRSISRCELKACLLFLPSRVTLILNTRRAHSWCRERSGERRVKGAHIPPQVCHSNE